MNVMIKKKEKKWKQKLPLFLSSSIFLGFYVQITIKKRDLKNGLNI